jgi:hypothetical protein
VKPIGIKIIKICLGVLLSLVLLISASTAVVMYLFPEEKIREIVIREATQTLNRKVAIGGFSYGLRGIVLKDLSVYDGQTEKDPLLTRAGEVSLGFSLLDLLHKKLSIRRIYVKDLGLNVVFDKNNVPNLQRLIEEILRNRGRESSMSASIDMIKLSDARISIIEPRGYFKPLGGEYLISGNLDLSAKNALSIDDCTVRMPETRGIAHPVITIAAKDGEVSISGDVKLDRASLLWVYQWAGTPTPPQPYDVVTGDVTNLLIRITKERNVIVEGNARASSTLINSRHIVHAEGFCRVNVDRQSVFISDLKGRIDSSSFLMQRLLFYFNGVLDQFEVKNASADIIHIRALLSAIPDRLYGFVRGDLMYDRKMFTGNLALKMRDSIMRTSLFPA